jgi:hypothetical protein
MDACQGDAKKPRGYGAILAQVKPDGEFQVISLASQKLKCHEKNYAPFLSSSVWAMEHYTMYLRGKHFVLYTDHKPLVNLGTIHMKTLNQMQEAMSTYDFEIIYQKGSEMLADYLSQNVVNSIQIEDGQMEKDQDAEEWISDIKKWMLNGTQANNANAKRYLNYYWANRFFIQDNLLWVRIQNRGEPTRVCVVLPSAEINRENVKKPEPTFIQIQIS